jgi:hypothetical protein
MFKRSTPRSNPQSSTGASSGSGIVWVACGGLVALAGVALGVQQAFGGPGAEIANTARSLGLEAGVLSVGGLVLVAVGSAVRALARRAAQPDDDTLLLERATSDLIVVKDSLEQSRGLAQAQYEELHALQAHVYELREAVAAVTQRGAEQAQGSGNEDALYRLAASLDQLGARMEQRMKAQYAEMQASLDELNGVVASVRRNVDELFQGVHGAIEAAAHVPPVAPAPVAQAPVAQNPVRSPHVEAPRAPLPVATAEPQQQALPLGLLDQLDDPLPPAPVAAPQHHVAYAQPAAHAPSHEAQAHAAPPAESYDDADAKLAELRALLSDDRLRAALEQIRRAQ